MLTQRKTMDITTQKNKIKNIFNPHSSLDIIEQTFLLDDAKEEFLENLNSTFGENGVYFQALESKIELRGNKAFYNLPKFSIHHHFTKESVGVLDAQNRTLELNIESRLKQLDDKIFALKQSIITGNSQINQIQDQLQKNKWNIFVKLFQRRKLKKLETSIARIKFDIHQDENSVYAAQSVRVAENEILATLQTLSNKMSEFGINVNIK